MFTRSFITDSCKTEIVGVNSVIFALYLWPTTLPIENAVKLKKKVTNHCCIFKMKSLAISIRDVSSSSNFCLLWRRYQKKTYCGDELGWLLPVFGPRFNEGSGANAIEIQPALNLLFVYNFTWRDRTSHPIHQKP